MHASLLATAHEMAANACIFVTQEIDQASDWRIDTADEVRGNGLKCAA